MQRVVVTGGAGFIGGHLVRALAGRGDAVTVPSRNAESASPRLPPGASAVAWDPSGEESWSALVDGQDAVVHLAGEPAVGQRWTEEKKAEIRRSRVETTERLVEAMRGAARKPRTFLCASGVGYYGARSSDEELDESAAPGSTEDFLSHVTQEWEAAARGAADFGVRVVSARFGIVLGRDGGALPVMAKPFRLFVGGPLGTGRQGFSWVHVEDAIGILLRCLDDEGIDGPVNVVAPAPVTNAELARAIGGVLRRPWFFRAPGTALRVRFGEGAEPMLTGQRVVPGVMRGKGYEWRYPDLESALREALKK